MNAFKLLAIAIVVTALIYVLLSFLGFLMQNVDFTQEVSEQLRKAEISLGKIQTRFFTVQDIAIKANIFETKSRNVVFNCNDLRYCCGKSLLNEFKPECEKGIAWNEKNISISKKLELDVSTRCYHDVINWCTIFVGRKPSEISMQLSIKEKEIITGKEYEIELTTINKGETFSVEIQRELYINLVEGTSKGINKTKIKEISLPPIRLGPEDELVEKIPFSVNYPGEIEVYAKAFETIDKTNFVETTTKLNASGETITENNCKADKLSEKSTEFDLSLSTCIEKYFCNNCRFAAECLIAWEKEGVSGLQERSSNYAVKDLNTQNC